MSIKEIVKNEECLETYGLVELELKKLEQEIKAKHLKQLEEIQEKFCEKFDNDPSIRRHTGVLIAEFRNNS